MKICYEFSGKMELSGYIKYITIDIWYFCQVEMDFNSYKILLYHYSSGLPWTGDKSWIPSENLAHQKLRYLLCAKHPVKKIADHNIWWLVPFER